jgi:hypothetical protein
MSIYRHDLRLQSIVGFAVFGLAALAFGFWPETSSFVACVVCGAVAVANFCGWVWLSVEPRDKEPRQ